MTSRWSMRQPAVSSAAICSPRRAKSAARIDGRISTMSRWNSCYHGSEKAIPGVAAGQPKMRGTDGQSSQNMGNDVVVFFPFERTSGVDQSPAMLQILESPPEDFTLHLGEARQICLAQPPLDLGIPR